jgi:hypothetical protein
MPAWFTVLIGALMTVLPQFIGNLPEPYKGAVTAIIAAAVAIYHLFQPPPGSAPKGKG